MKKLYLFSLSFLSLSAFADQSLETIVMTKPLPNNTVVRQHSSLKDAPEQIARFKRTTNYPTQIVRMQAELKESTQTCDEVFQKIDAFFSDQISYDRFFYNTINYCGYDPETQFARQFTINSYFDPLDDEAIIYLEKYLAEHNGRDLLGSPFYVESAQGLVVSLNIDAGMEDSANDSTLLRLQHDNASHYFPSNYAMRLDLISDVRQRFFSNKPDLVLPFIDKWFLTSVWYYQHILHNSNYVELQPELIFLMDKSPKIFSPLLRLYFAHHCSKYESKRCL